MVAKRQIFDVPDAPYWRLELRAAQAGMSLSDYLLTKIGHIMERPTLDEFRVRLQTRSEVTLFVEPAVAVRNERGLP